MTPETQHQLDHEAHMARERRAFGFAWEQAWSKATNNNYTPALRAAQPAAQVAGWMVWLAARKDMKP